MILSASAISTTFKKVSLTTAGIASFLALSTASAHAATLNNINIAPGTGFTLPGTFSASDTLDLIVSGTVNTLGGQDTDEYTTNAAGIVTVETIFENSIGTAAAAGGFSGFSSGALLIGNDTLGFRQLFASNAANGLGNNVNPPTTLSTGSVTLASIFGAFTGDTSLEFAIEPNFSFADSATTSGPTEVISLATAGGFTLNGTVGQASATDVPEPFTIVGTLIGGTAALRMIKKLKANNN